MSLYVYLDWNIFNKIEKLDQLKDEELNVYSLIKNHITTNNIVVPYSNAHISDLARGYAKNPAFTDLHLSTITLLTNNLCIVQYWGEQKVKWHYRDPKEFLERTLEDAHSTNERFSDLLYLEDEPLLNRVWEIQKSLMRLTPVDSSFRQIYSIDPIFNSLYPRTKIEMNLLALCEDLFSFSSRIKTDYSLYKHFQKFLTQLRLKMPQYQKLYAQAQQKIIGLPDHLTWENLVDQSLSHHTYKSPNAAYDKIFNLFTTIDLKGYSSDERFTNLIDDALHCFYAAHCHYFITIDRRCSDKAKKVFEKLNLPTVVCSPNDFISKMS